MKLLSATAAATTTNKFESATAIYVTTTAAHIVTIIDSDGTANSNNGTIVGSVTLPSNWTGVVSKDAGQFIKGNNTSAWYTQVNSAGY